MLYVVVVSQEITVFDAGLVSQTVSPIVNQ